MSKLEENEQVLKAMNESLKTHNEQQKLENVSLKNENEALKQSVDAKQSVNYTFSSEHHCHVEIYITQINVSEGNSGFT